MSRGPAVVLYGLSSNPTREVSLNDNDKTHFTYELVTLSTAGIPTYGTVGTSGPWDSDLGRDRDLDTGGRKPD